MKNITYQVPENNKEVFLDPSIGCIPDLIQANRDKIQGYKFAINGIPFQIFREKTRKALLQKAVCFTEGISSLLKEGSSVSRIDAQQCTHINNSEQINKKWQTLNNELNKDVPVIQTGHEPVLYHPGIWIKNHLMQSILKKAGGVGVNMIVDNDACNMGFIYVPVLSDKPASVHKVTFIEGKEGVAYEEIIFDLEMILQFKERVVNLLEKNVLNKAVITTTENMLTMFESFISSVVDFYRCGCIDMVGLLTTARRSLEEDFCFENLEIPVSRMCDVDGFFHYFLHIVYDAERFAKIYNEKLAEYRSIHKIRSRANPLPDLKITDKVVEVPFWVWKAGEKRHKCYVERDKGSINVTNGIDILVALKEGDDAEGNISLLKATHKSHIKIRPRAITATMFSRLFFADIFIHGIGGAKYDTITDEIIKEFFCIDPPAYITTSATLFLPLDTPESDITSLQVLQHEIKDMVYNPERYAPKEIQYETEFKNRVAEKQRILAVLEKCSKEEKRRYFYKIKELNKAILYQLNGEFQRRQNEINTLQHHLNYHKTVKFREYPIQVYPMNFLREYFLYVFSEGRNKGTIQ